MATQEAEARVIVGSPVSVPVIWTATNGDKLNADVGGDKVIGIHQELAERDVTKRGGLRWGHAPRTKSFDSLKNMDCINADPDGFVAFAERLRDTILASRKAK